MLCAVTCLCGGEEPPHSTVGTQRRGRCLSSGREGFGEASGQDTSQRRKRIVC